VDLDIAGHYVAITGASRGIGKAIAIRFLHEGANVALIARRQEQVEATATQLGDQFGAERVIGLSADCADSSALGHIHAFLAEKWAGLDTVVANVGDGRSVPDAIPDAGQWDKVWRTNFDTALVTARVFLPLVQKRHGSLLFISSIAGLEAFGAPVDYSTAKTAVIAFAQNLAHKVAPGVRVNVIAPGNIHFPGSPWEPKLQANPVAVEQMLRDQVPLQRFGTPEEIADAAVFLCSPRASFITGAVLRIDGGQTVSLL
jgi:3-oxoacyl-[acyl-carrier protein] reductase